MELSVLQTDNEVKEEVDSIGGFTVLDSDVYLFEVKTAYITLAASKAMALNIEFEGVDKKEKLRSVFYMTSGEAKGCKNYYINKQGDKHYLPGFNQANALCLMTCGKEIASMATEKKVINLYSPEEKKEVPTKVDMVMELLGKKIYAAVLRQLEDKSKKNEATGKYVPTGETRETNEVDKFFRERDKMTVVEIKAKATEPTFITKWLDKWKDKIKDKTDKKATGATAGAPRLAGKQSPQEDLFK